MCIGDLISASILAAISQYHQGYYVLNVFYSLYFYEHCKKCVYNE